MIGIPELALLGLAAYRATRLVVSDVIADPPRDAVLRWCWAKDTAPRRLLEKLIGCTYCTGWWVSGAILATYLLTTGGWREDPLLLHGVEWLAVAGAQALANAVDGLMERGADTLGSAGALADRELTRQLKAETESGDS